MADSWIKEITEAIYKECGWKAIVVGIAGVLFFLAILAANLIKLAAYAKFLFG